MADITRQNGIDQGFNTAAEAIAQGKSVEQIQTKYHTAVRVQQPRDLVQVEKRCLTEAALAGERCFYGWGVGQNRVEGPSIDCAMIAARNWGNLAMDMAPVHETQSAWIFDAHVIDIETGFTYSRQFRQSKKWQVYGKLDPERKDDVRFQIGQSKAQRNAILRFVPGWLTDKMIERAKEGIREKLDKAIQSKGIGEVRKRALDALARFSVTQEMVERKYGRKYPTWDLELLVILQGDIAALSSGAETADTLYAEPEDENASGNGAGDPDGLSEADMSPGDPSLHQGHEPQDKKDKADKKDPKKGSGGQVDAGF